jgi:hypothetical protein
MNSRTTPANNGKATIHGIRFSIITYDLVTLPASLRVTRRHPAISPGKARSYMDCLPTFNNIL